MAIALSIFKIKGINKKVFLNPMKNKITLNDFEKRIDDYTDVNGNPAPSTILRRKHVNQKKNIADYAVEHWTDTTKDIIRVFVDDLQDSMIYNKYNIVPKTTYNISHGYQMKIDFKVSIYFKDEYIFVFSNKRYSKQFIKRLENVGALKYKQLKLKIKDITKNSNIQNINTVWEDEAENNVKKIGYIGVQVHKDKRIDLGKATAIRVEINKNDKTLPDVYLTEDCRLSSLSKHVTKHDLIEVFMDFKDRLMIDEGS